MWKVGIFQHLTNVMNYAMFIKKRLDKNKQSFIHCLVLLYFIWYAMSPLSATFSIKKIAHDEYAAGEAVASYKCLKIFLLELICSKIDEKEDAGQNNSTGRVLIRKTRVILPEDVHPRFLPLKYHALRDYIPLLFYNFLSGLSVSSDEQITAYEFYPLHSGPSPPSASS